MLLAMVQEPFYSKYLYVNEQLGLYAGGFVHQGSFSDCMPVENEDRSIALLLHGEVFTPQDQLDRLRRKGHRFSNTDASYLVHLYEDLKDDFFEALNGTFCGVVADSRRGKLKVFNDRIGFEKMYYSEKGGVFYFSSQAKSLLQAVPSTRTFDEQGLAQLLSYRCTFGDRTLYHGMSLLPAASAWEFGSGNLSKKKTYFHPEHWQVNPTIDVESFHASFREIFCSVLPEYFSGKLRPALSLTGGWDTRMILASCGAEPGTLPCYTFSGSSGDTTDVTQARKVAAVAGQEYSVLRLQSDFLTDFGKHAERAVYFSDGMATVTLAHELYLNSLARRIAPVRITGNFGSEVLRGVSTFKRTPLKREWLQSGLKEEIERCTEDWRVRQETDGARLAIFTEIPWKLSTVFRLANCQLPVRSPFLDNAILKLACICPPLVLQNAALPSSLIGRENAKLLAVPTDRGESGDGSVLRTILRRTLYSATFKIEYLLCDGAFDFFSLVVDATKIQKLLPLRHRYLDYRRWFRKDLKGYVQDVLGNHNNLVSGILGRKAVARVLSDNASGIRNELPNVDTLMTLELIDKCLLSARDRLSLQDRRDSQMVV
jgi:asparagine synthase (glutamine-hydrolysing)